VLLTKIALLSREFELNKRQKYCLNYSIGESDQKCKPDVLFALRSGEINVGGSYPIQSKSNRVAVKVQLFKYNYFLFL
jgi:hypothetical protein